MEAVFPGCKIACQFEHPTESELPDESSRIDNYSAPNRLAVWIYQVCQEQARRDKSNELTIEVRTSGGFEAKQATSHKPKKERF